MVSTLLRLVAGLSLLIDVGAALAEADFYKGRTVFIYIGFAPGGSYDYFGRVVARHLGQHLPGNPTVVAELMPGAGSFTAANFLYARAPKDGTALGIVSQTVAVEEALGTPGVHYKVAEFNWIGVPRRSTRSRSPTRPRKPKRSPTRSNFPPPWRAPAPARRRKATSGCSTRWPEPGSS